MLNRTTFVENVIHFLEILISMFFTQSLCVKIWNGDTLLTLLIKLSWNLHPKLNIRLTLSIIIRVIDKLTISKKNMKKLTKNKN